MKVKDRLISLIIYSLLFPLLWMGIYYHFYQIGKSFMWLGDGMDQHYPALYYLGNYYKKILPHLIKGRFLSIPMIDFSVGMGFDILTTLSYYGLGDPLLLLTIFWKPEAMESAYNWIIILRTYLAGLAFLAYCFYMRLERRGSIIGAFLYIFCGYGVYAAVRHPFFCIPMVYFPIMLIGVERMIDSDGKDGLFFSFTTALAVISNFYFFYMLTVLTFLYGAVRYFDINAKPAIKNAVKTFCFSAFHYILGLGLAGIFLLPILIAYKNNSRLDTLFINNNGLYEWSYYLKSVYNLFTPIILDDYWSILSLTPLALIVLFILYQQKHQYLGLKILILISILLYSFPLGGSLMNGMGYVSNRWLWGFSFLIAVTCALLFDKILHDLPFLRIFITLLILSALPFYVPILQDIRIYTGLFLCILLLFILSLYRGSKRKRTSTLLVSAITGFALLANGYFLFSPYHSSYLHEFVDKGQAFNHVMASPAANSKEIEDEGLYRISLARQVSCINQSLILDYYGTTSYYSITDRYFAEYCMNLEVNPFWTLYRMEGFDKRSVLETMASVKYFYASEAQETQVPHGFREISRIPGADNTFILYENSSWLPFGYTYPSYISAEEAVTMNGLERQQGMTQAVLLQEAPGPSISKAVIQNTVEAIPYQITKNDNHFSEAEKSLTVHDGAAGLELTFELEKPGEVYIRFQGFNIDDSGYESLYMTCKGPDGNIYGYRNIHSRSSNYYCMEDFLIPLGYREAGPMKRIVNFDKSGVYQLEKLEVFVADMDATSDYLSALKEEPLQDIVFSPNQISGRIEVSADKILCLSIPYSKGWKAYIDGTQTPIYRGNIMYMAVEVAAGSHDVRLRYQTPGLKAGSLLSGFALLYVSGIWGYRKLKNDKRRPSQ